MPFNATSYFAGVFTVLATVAIGFGGGIMMTDAFVGQSDKTTSMARRAVPPSVPVAVTAQGPAAAAVPVSQAAAAAVPVPQAAAAAVPAPQAADVEASSRPVQTVIQEPPKPAMDAMARASDAETKQALAAERRKADRRKRAERHKREIKRIEQQNLAAEQTRAEPSFAQPPRISLFPSD